MRLSLHEKRGRRSTQLGQYLRGFYEMHPFMTVRQWGGCSTGAGGGDNEPARLKGQLCYKTEEKNSYITTR